VRLTAAQQKAGSELMGAEERAVALMDVVIEYEALQKKITRTSPEEDRLKALSRQIEAGNRGVSEFFENVLYPSRQDATNLSRI
jgi:hypothetical protein